MKVVIFIISFIALPSLVFSAYNDATLTTSAIISVGGYTLNISGSSAVVESMMVNFANFSVTLESGSSITITSPTRNQFTTDISTGVTNTCNSTVSSLAITGIGTVTITPSATICVDATPTPTSSGRSISSGGSRISPQALAQLLGQTPTVNITVPTMIYKIITTKILSVGQTNADIKTLQQYLNAKGYVVATTGVGSKGKETTLFGALTKKALMKFQKAHGMPATGNLGPLTKAFINAHP